MFLLFHRRQAKKKYKQLQFTFQYVSIISLMRIGLKKRLSHLHSNMFLLFPKEIKELDENKVVFTFQYVSIISLRTKY